MAKVLFFSASFISVFSFAQKQDSINKILEKQIKTIEIKANKKLIEMKTNKFVFNVEESGFAAGGNGIDILNITPGLQVNNEQISMIGKSGLGVMVDGRLLKLSGDELTSFLKNLKADDIKSIEVISNPSAKYSAEGNSGLVNVVMKKNKGDFWRLNVSNTFQQATKSQNTTSLNFNYKKNKISLYSGLSYNYGKYIGEEYSDVHYPLSFWNSTTNSTYTNNGLSAKLGLDYDINKNFQVGFFYTGSYSKPVTENNDYTKTTVNNIAENYDTYGLTDKKRNFNSFNLHAVNKLDSSGIVMNTDFDFFDYTDRSDRTFDAYLNSKPISTKSNINNSTQSIKNYSLNVDVEHPTKFTKLNYGGRLSFSDTSNELYADINAVGFSQNDLFKYKENTQALFLSAEKELGKKWSTELGLRWENTQLEGNSISLQEINKKNYSKLFPTFYLTFTPTKNHSLSFQYGKRIGRTGFSNLNPFRVYYSPFSYWEGNPNIMPSYTHNIELNFVYKGILQSVLSYQKTSDAFAGIVLLNSNDQTQKITQLNYADTESYGFRQTYVYNKKKWMKAYVTGYAGYQIANSKIAPLTPEKVEGTYLNFTLNSSFTLSKKTNAGFNFSHRLAAKSLDLVYNEPNTMLSLFFQTTLWDKLNMSVNINNLFREYVFNSTSERNGYPTSTHGYFDSRYIRLTLSYSFGGNINVKNRENKNLEEQNRTN